MLLNYYHQLAVIICVTKHMLFGLFVRVLIQCDIKQWNGDLLLGDRNTFVFDLRHQHLHVRSKDSEDKKINVKKINFDDLF